MPQIFKYDHRCPWLPAPRAGSSQGEALGAVALRPSWQDVAEAERREGRTRLAAQDRVAQERLLRPRRAPAAPRPRPRAGLPRQARLPRRARARPPRLAAQEAVEQGPQAALHG